MKIVQIIHGFPPENMAGSEVYTYNLSKELAKQHQVWVFYRIADPSREEYEIVRSVYDGISVCKINNLFRYSTSFTHTYRNDVIAQKFGEFLDEVKPDVVHFGHVTCLSTTCIAEAHRRKIPIVYTLHDYWLICPRGQFVKRDLRIDDPHEDVDCVQCMAYQLDIDGGHERVNKLTGRIKPYIYEHSVVDKTISFHQRFLSHSFFAGQQRAIKQIENRRLHIKEMCGMVDQFISPSRFLKQKYMDFGIPENKILYSDYGFQDEYFQNITRSNFGKIRFGYIGTLIPTKGVHVLIKAFNRIAATNAELRIFGRVLPYDGVEKYGEYLNDLVKTPNIFFMGEYDNRKIGEVLARIDVLVVPSIWFENSPLTIHEAFLANVPVITSNIGGMKELVRDGKEGLLFEMGNDEDLARAIRSLIDSPQKIAAMSKSISGVKTIEANALEIEEIYRRLDYRG